MMRLKKRILALFLALVLPGALVTPTYAAGSPTVKEEVIYVNADAGGSVEDVYAVNIFDGGEITDYGEYSAVKMLNTTDPIVQSSDTITFSTSAEKAYYQGDLENSEIPWNISIRYFLDGTEYRAGEIVGRSGKLDIQFKITQNPACSSYFFDSYSLQAAFTIDTDKCSSIIADDATIANAGKNKQLNYAILAGRGIDTSISADVTDFEMNAVSINAVKLRLNVEIDDQELLDKVDKLLDGMTKIDDGTAALSEGGTDLKAGGGSLIAGAASLKSGAASLDDGVSKLQSGIIEAQKGLDELTANSDSLVSGSAGVKEGLHIIQESLSSVSSSSEDITELANASGQIKAGIDDLYDDATALQNKLSYAGYKAAMSQYGLDIESLTAANGQTAAELSAQIGDIQTAIAQIEVIPGYESEAAQLQSQIVLLRQMLELLVGNNAAIAGTASYLDALSGGISDLSAGAAELKNNYAAFDSAVSELAGALGDVLGSLNELSNGINELAAKYEVLDSGIVNYTNGAASLAAGYTQIVDGVADLAGGSRELCEGYNDLYGGAADLYGGIVSLCDGAAELSDGTDKMIEETAAMDIQVQEQIDEILETIQGDGSETIFFVSEKDTNVESVQFVIRTADIKTAESSVTEIEPEENLNFFQKFLKLFGVY